MRVVRPVPALRVCMVGLALALQTACQLRQCTTAARRAHLERLQEEGSSHGARCGTGCSTPAAKQHAWTNSRVRPAVQVLTAPSQQDCCAMRGSL